MKNGGNNTDSGGKSVALSRLRKNYRRFRLLQTLNNECLEGINSLQEDMHYIPPSAPALGKRVSSIIDRAGEMVRKLEELGGGSFSKLSKKLEGQRSEIESWLAANRELAPKVYSAWLSDLSLADEGRAGAKAAALGEVENGVGLPVPPGYVLTTEAYEAFFGLPCWKEVRDALRRLTLDDDEALRSASEKLIDMVMDRELPRAVEIAVTERAARICAEGAGMAVRSSAVGEGGSFSFAGQFLSLLNVPRENLGAAYRRVVASRFSERAIFYRMVWGLQDVKAPMAVLFLPTLDALAAGILYTRDPSNPSSRELWISATPGLGAEIAEGAVPADRFVVSRSGIHTVLEREAAHKDTLLFSKPGGGLARRPIEEKDSTMPCLRTEHLQILADWGVRLEKHFKVPQDVEWVLDRNDRLWIVQTRPLVLSKTRSERKNRVNARTLLSGGSTIYPGRVSSTARHISSDTRPQGISMGSIAVIERPSAEIVKIFPRIAGLVAERGNEAGHAAALLREFGIPSVFNVKGLLEAVGEGEPVSLDAQLRVIYEGTLWPEEKETGKKTESGRVEAADPIDRRLVALNLIDPSDVSFRPSKCRSVHDVVRLVHQKSVEAMFNVNDAELRDGVRAARLVTPVPVNVYVMDLGGGVVPSAANSDAVRPEEILSRPFGFLWGGITHPGVKWQREMPASFEGITSVLARSISSRPTTGRNLGDRSYLLVSDEYMNLNTRLAYHFTMVDACLSEIRNRNHIAFRFVGGGASRRRRKLRVRFIESVLDEYGFTVDLREDLLNAWFKKASAVETGRRLDILGRLIACAGQLDMYMTGEKEMLWYVEQFLNGNYGFDTASGTLEP